MSAGVSMWVRTRVCKARSVGHIERRGCACPNGLVAGRCTPVWPAGQQERMPRLRPLRQPVRPRPTSVRVWVPMVHRLTLRSSPPVTSTPELLRPILQQFTLPWCATNSSVGGGWRQRAQGEQRTRHAHVCMLGPRPWLRQCGCGGVRSSSCRAQAPAAAACGRAWRSRCACMHVRGCVQLRAAQARRAGPAWQAACGAAAAGWRGPGARLAVKGAAGQLPWEQHSRILT